MISTTMLTRAINRTLMRCLDFLHVVFIEDALNPVGIATQQSPCRIISTGMAFDPGLPGVCHIILKLTGTENPTR